MIYNQLNQLDDILKSTNKDIHVDLHACLTTQVENLHAVSHFKDQRPTSLNYSHNLGNTVYESIKRITSWAAYYFTHPTSYLIPHSSIPLKDISKLSYLGKTRHLNFTQEQIMREWAVQHGKCIWQRTVGQETTKFKGGTLTFNVSSCRFCLHKEQNPPWISCTISASCSPIVNKQVTSAHPEVSEALSPRRWCAVWDLV